MNVLPLLWQESRSRELGIISIWFLLLALALICCIVLDKLFNLSAHYPSCKMGKIFALLYEVL